MPLPTTIVLLTAALCGGLLNTPVGTAACLVAAFFNELFRMFVTRSAPAATDEYSVRVPSVRQKTPFGPPREEDD